MILKKLNLVILLSVFIMITSCNSNDDDTPIDNSMNCDFTTIIGSQEYTNAPSDQITTNNLEIIESCLKINFSASGCSGNSWELKLIDSEDILESDPPQRNIRLSLKNEEECEAFITKELSFDISNLQVNGNQVQLNITNSDHQILYTY